MQVGEKLPVYISKNPDFRLPALSTTPIIMVGPGTGLAPFRYPIQKFTLTPDKWPFDWIPFHEDGVYRNSEKSVCHAFQSHPNLSLPCKYLFRASIALLRQNLPLHSISLGARQLSQP